MPGLRVGRRPRRHERGLEPVARAEDRDALALDRRAVRPVRLAGVVPEPGDRELGGGDRRERVLHAARAVVERVVVRHVHDVDARRLQRGERRRRRAEVVVLPGDRLAAVGDRGLDVHHRQVGVGEHRRDRVEHVVGIGADAFGERWCTRRRPVLGVPHLGEVDVAGERERHRVAVAARPARVVAVAAVVAVLDGVDAPAAVEPVVPVVPVDARSPPPPSSRTDVITTAATTMTTDSTPAKT